MPQAFLVHLCMAYIRNHIKLPLASCLQAALLIKAGSQSDPVVTKLSFQSEGQGYPTGNVREG